LAVACISRARVWLAAPVFTDTIRAITAGCLANQANSFASCAMRPLVSMVPSRDPAEVPTTASAVARSTPPLASVVT
jgi:hypothetical protein